METTEPIKEPGKIESPLILDAFEKIQREDFLPSDLKELASLNEALPLGYGQTISQPLVVGFMLELLDPKAGQKILDIGAGSGWTTALLAHLVSQQGISKPQGRVIAIEVIPELKEFGERNVAKYNFTGKGVVKFLCANGIEGHKKEAPYDGILVSASLPARRPVRQGISVGQSPERSRGGVGGEKKELPPAWKKQLKLDGKIVVPIQNSIWVFHKISETDFEQKEYPGFMFVPFVS